MPKVALLFLTSGELFHEPTWEKWFASAEGLLPALHARETACEEAPQYWDAVQSYCSIKGLGSAIAKQHLFSVYVHAPPAFKGEPSPESASEAVVSWLPPWLLRLQASSCPCCPPGRVGFFGDSLWSGHMIPERVKTAWGSSTLIEAARYLLFEAFKDPLNERFMLLSESDVPLYDPLTLYSQLVYENASRINACGPGDHTSSWRWNPAMEVGSLPRVDTQLGGQRNSTRTLRSLPPPAAAARAEGLALAQELPVFRPEPPACRGGAQGHRHLQVL